MLKRTMSTMKAMKTQRKLRTDVRVAITAALRVPSAMKLSATVIIERIAADDSLSIAEVGVGHRLTNWVKNKRICDVGKTFVVHTRVAGMYVRHSLRDVQK